jgi:hypothetical protein
MLDIKAELPFTVCNIYSFLTAALVARKRPYFGETFIACPLLLIGRGKLINYVWFLKYLILFRGGHCNYWPRAPKLTYATGPT